MPYKIQYTEQFKIRVCSLKLLPQAQKMLKKTIEELSFLDDPKTRGGKYNDGWALLFYGLTFITCDIDDATQTIYLTGIST